MYVDGLGGSQTDTVPGEAPDHPRTKSNTAVENRPGAAGQS